MGERPKPTEAYILELLGRNIDLVRRTDRGLYEVPLNAVYPLLNLEEALALAGFSWLQRNINYGRFFIFLASASKEDLLQRLIEKGLAEIDQFRELQPESLRLHKRLNPFDRKTLTRRISLIPETEFEALKAKLNTCTNKYAESDDEYERLKLKQRGRTTIRGTRSIGSLMPNVLEDLKRRTATVSEELILASWVSESPREVMYSTAEHIVELISNFPTIIAPTRPKQPRLF